MRRASETRLFAVIGAQRTGTNILRELLNSNEFIAMQGEVLTPSSAPAHWDNFLETLPAPLAHVRHQEGLEALLDSYFDFVEYRIRKHWIGGDKSKVRAIGVDVKYNQMRRISPHGWLSDRAPFLLDYLKSREAVVIHMVRRNVVHCAISAIVAQRRRIWHNYTGAAVDRSYDIDPDFLLSYVRTITRDRELFLEFAGGCTMVELDYEGLAAEIEQADVSGELPGKWPGLRRIAQILSVPFQFRYDGRLRKAINVPYTQLISNHAAIVEALKNSEFESFASTLS